MTLTPPKLSKTTKMLLQMSNTILPHLNQTLLERRRMKAAINRIF